MGRTTRSISSRCRRSRIGQSTVDQRCIPKVRPFTAGNPPEKGLGIHLKRILLVLCMALLSCSLADQVANEFSPASSPETSITETVDQSSPTPTIDISGAGTVYVAPFCTLLGEGDTQTETYGNIFILSWGWIAQTKQQVLDYLENAVTKVTFNGEEITDAERGDVYAEDEAYHVNWYKTLGILDRGKYAMTFFEKYRSKIFDGWEYFGPGTDKESVENTCYLIVE
jgi:hypothetical protein